MSSKELSVTKINMYIDMIGEEFEPLMNEVSAMESGMRSKLKEQTIEDLGLNVLIEEFETISKQLTKLIEKTKPYLQIGWHYHGGNDNELFCTTTSDLDKIVSTRMQVLRRGPIEEVYNAKKSLENRIRLAGVGEDIRKAFVDLPRTLSALKKQFAALPDPTTAVQASIPLTKAKKGKS